jgi:hypothetical protein
MKGTRVLLLAAILVHLMTTVAAANHFKVDSVSIAATPNTYTGKCPTVAIKVGGEIMVSGTRDWGLHPFGGATVTYTFIRSDGQPDFERQLPFKPTVGDFDGKGVLLSQFPTPNVPFFSITGDPGSSTKGWVAIKILSPNQMESEKANYELNCLAPQAEPTKKPDLTCTIAAYKDPDHKEKIDSGTTVSFSGPSPKVYVVPSLQNIGTYDVMPLQNFDAYVEYKINGKSQGTPKFSVTGPVPVGQTPRMFGVMDVPVPPGSGKIEVTGNVNPSNSGIPELTKDNNQCTFSLTTSLPPAQVAPKPSRMTPTPRR